MAITKSGAQVDEWAEIPANVTDGTDVRFGAIVDVSDSYSVALAIKVALSSTTAHTGTEIIVQYATDPGGDARDNWIVLVRFIVVTGTAVLLAFNATEPAGETVLSLVNPVAANMDNDQKFRFIENTVPADSEIVWVKTNSGDAGDTITIDDGLAHEQDVTTSIMYDIDDLKAEAVSQTVVVIPDTADRIRIKYNNHYDPDGSTVFTSARITKVTGI